MAHLYLMRHAQAGDGSRDFLRPLTDHGRAQAAARRSDLPKKVEVAYVSGARRAQETANECLVGVECERIDLDDLYTAGSRQIIDLIAGRESAIVIGHEPIISQCAALLAARDPRVHEIRGGVSPSTVIHLEADSFEPGTATIVGVARG